MKFEQDRAALYAFLASNRPIKVRLSAQLAQAHSQYSSLSTIRKELEGHPVDLPNIDPKDLFLRVIEPEPDPFPLDFRSRLTQEQFDRELQELTERFKIDFVE